MNDLFNILLTITIVFVLLKLGGVITLSWLAVTAPIWVPLGFVITACVLGGILYGIGYLFEWIMEKIEDKKN